MTDADLRRIVAESTPEAAAETVYAALYREPERLAEVFATCRAVRDELKARHGSTPPLEPDLVRWMRFRVCLLDAAAGTSPLPQGDDR